jgi:hypothetical protein
MQMQTQMRKLRHHCRYLLLVAAKRMSFSTGLCNIRLPSIKLNQVSSICLIESNVLIKHCPCMSSVYHIIAYTRSRSYRASFDENSPPLATLAHLPPYYIPLLRSIMRRNAPFRYWDTGRRDETTSRHTVPLGVQEDLKTEIGSTLSLNDKDSNSIV